jgi:hypothetical protein
MVRGQTVWALMESQSRRTHRYCNVSTLRCRLVVVMTLSQDMGGPHTPANPAKLSLRLKLFGVEVWARLGGVEAIWKM